MEIGNLDHNLVSSMMEDATAETGSKRRGDQISGGRGGFAGNSTKRVREEDMSVVASLMEGDEPSTVAQTEDDGAVDQTAAEGYHAGPWQYEEDERLIQAAASFKLPDNNVDWTRVSRHIGNRSEKQCNVRWNTLLKYRGTSNTRRGGWSAEEDARLLEAIRRNERKGGGIFWTKVCEEMGGERTYQQCLKRWRQVLQHIGSGARIGAWSEAEDNLLLEAMSLYEGQGKCGGMDWNKVSTHLGGVRAPTQCYKRWHDAIKQRRKHLKGVVWTEEELSKLNEAVQLFAGDGLGGGVEWGDVAAHVGTKTTKECCSQWNRSARAGNKELVTRLPRIRTDPWDEMEERALFMGVEACREPAVDNQGDAGELVNVNWEKISTDFLNHIRTPKQCAKKWESIVRNKMRDDMKLAADLEQYQEPQPTKTRERGLKSGIWTAADDDLLIEAVALYEGQGRGGAVDWGRVCEYVGSERTYDQCRIRFNGVVKMLKQKGACVKNGSWEPGEDEKLIEAVGLFEGQGRGGGVNWAKVSEFFHGERTPNQCHSHWSSIVKPRENGARTSPWSDLDDIKLCEAVVVYMTQGKGGTVDWIKVRDHVCGDRSTYQLRMRWHSTLKNRVTPIEPRSHGERRKSLAPPPWSEDEVERLVATVEACRLPPAPGEVAESITEAAVGGKLVAHLIDWNTVSNAMTDASLPGFNTEKRTPLQCLHRWREAISEMIADAGVSVIDGNDATLNNTPWSEEEDQRLMEAVAVYNGHGRGGGIDWGKVCEYLGANRKYNQCRHRWHNVLKQRANREDAANTLPLDYNREAMGWVPAPSAPVAAPVQPVIVPPQQPTGHPMLEAYANIAKYDV